MIQRIFIRLAIFCVLYAPRAWGQQGKPDLPRDDDHAVVLEIGVAAAHTLGERAEHWGATVAAEVTPL